jgi:hypothetical protein
MLPDDVLLEIFDFYVDKDMGEDFKRIEGWITLAHVCRFWRSVVFQSPRRLNLRLLCTTKTRRMETLDIWPPFPLVIYSCWNGTSGVDNIIAALGRNDRVSQIKIQTSTLEHFTDSAAMQKPFPELTNLHLGGHLFGRLPDSFLGGTAPRLRSLCLDGVPFPGLPKLLLSATHLVNLDLSDIPRSGYIPPEAMATSLSALTSLESLHLEFRYPRPGPALESRRPPPPPLTRSTLPRLTKILFKGTSEYLEEILAGIDAPRLNKMHMYFFNLIKFHTPQLLQFISQIPTLRAPEKGHIAFTFEAIIVKFPSRTSDYDALGVRIECTAERQLSSLGQVCTSSLPPLSTLEDLYIFVDRANPPPWQDDVENASWLELLHPFAAVKNLYLCDQIVPRIAPVLQELVGARTTEVLPTLENIFLEPSAPGHEGIEKFVAARRLTSHPVAVSIWDRDSV